MNPTLLRTAVAEIKEVMYQSITTASYGNRTYDTGLSAKTGLIRSESLIQRIHEVTKQSVHAELNRRNINHEVHPPLGARSPELNVWGFLKKKKQDVVILAEDVEAESELIREGPLTGQMDELGRRATSRSIVIGVRSQLSSIAKNFDTLMERTFAETINLRFRHPRLVMGEVYLLAVKDYDEQLMKENQVGWRGEYTDVEKFISIFNSMSGRDDFQDMNNFYKYERCLLLLVDFSLDPPKIYETIEELRIDGIVRNDFRQDFARLSPINFSYDLVEAYLQRHGFQ